MTAATMNDNTATLSVDNDHSPRPLCQRRMVFTPSAVAGGHLVIDNDDDVHRWRRATAVHHPHLQRGRTAPPGFGSMQCLFFFRDFVVTGLLVIGSYGNLVTELYLLRS